MKACPFCGGKADIYVHEADKAERVSVIYSVKCSKCQVETDRFMTKQAAELMWEKRSGLADASPLIAWLDIHSGIVLHTVGDDKPRVNGFNLKGEGDRRDHYRITNWVKLSEFFRNPQ